MKNFKVLWGMSAHGAVIIPIEACELAGGRQGICNLFRRIFAKNPTWTELRNNCFIVQLPSPPVAGQAHDELATTFDEAIADVLGVSAHQK